MRSTSPACKLAWVVVMVFFTVAAIVSADRGRAQPRPDAAAKAQRLDQLFDRLKSTTDEGEADAAAAEIWQLWQRTGTPELDELMERVSALIGQGLARPALPMLDDMVARAPDWAEAWNKRATALYLAGEHDRSLADIDRVLALEPRHFGALAGMGLIHIARGQYREALAAYRRALSVHPFLKERLQLLPVLEQMVGDKPT
jgi:tetratricopeptide (TPR) repeat protein